MPSELASFENPPVVETVLGVDFRPIEEITNAHLGAYWAKKCEDWPLVTDAQPIESEEPLTSWLNLSTTIRLHQEASCRLQMRNRESTRMLQIQRDLFRYNWLKNGTVYPRYSTIISEFDSELQQWLDYSHSISEKPAYPLKWEILYLNDIPKGSVWDSLDSVNKAFTFAASPFSGERTRTKSFRLEWSTEYGDPQCWLTVQISHGSHKDKEILRVTLRARGELKNFESVRNGLDLGHEAIVTTFEELTSSSSHAFWGKH